MKLRKYSEPQLRNAEKTSVSLRQVLKKLQAAPYGGNYEVLKRAINHFGLDCSHVKGQGWSRGTIAGQRQPISKFLSNEPPIQSYKLRNKLLKEGIFNHQYSNGGLTEWLNNPIPLELDHRIGDNKDNRLNNLRLLCPNCHALTPDYRGKNKSSRA